MFRDVLDQIGDLPPAVPVVAVALLAYSETARFLDLVVPGEVGMVLAGAAAAEAGVPLTVVAAAGFVGAVSGDSTSYWIGRGAGPRVVHRFRWTRKRLEPALERARRYFGRSGGWAVLGGRFVGALRAVVPFVAGSADMGFGRFLAWNVVASLAWAGAVVSAGYVLGDDIASVIDRVGGLVSVVVVVALIPHDDCRDELEREARRLLAAAEEEAKLASADVPG